LFACLVQKVHDSSRFLVLPNTGKYDVVITKRNIVYMSLSPNSLKTDNFLLWQTGLTNPLTTEPDRKAMVKFFGISERTAARWCLRGLPAYAKRQLTMIIEGRMLPPSWKGLQVVPDGLMAGNFHIPISHLRFWPFLMQCMDWSKAPVQILRP
jgi:hypothetical protein